jgi:hypothetical protein
MIVLQKWRPDSFVGFPLPLRRLHPTNADYSSRALTQDDGRSAGEGQVVDLGGLPARDGGGIKAGIFGVRFCAGNR